ncbi:MAG: hypothetical protein JRI52_04180 [Deltaproteobacteria bacterium]|nr:hypothetical protein [Deltaproteobacteria bacterium]
MKRYLLFCLFLIFFYPSTLHATRIALVAKVHVISDQDWIEVKVTVENQGDEDALVVSPQLKLGQEEVMLDHIPKLEPNHFHRWTHRFEVRRLGFQLRGSYPLLLKTHYHDVNFYPFSMPEVLLLHYQIEPSDPPIKGSLGVESVSHTGKAMVNLTNLSQHDLSGTVELFLPGELISRTPKTPFQLAKAQNMETTFQLENAWALRGSSYRVYAIAQWVHSNTHYTLVLPRLITVAGYKSTGSVLPRIVGGVLFLIILFIATLYVEIKKATQENEPA